MSVEEYVSDDRLHDKDRQNDDQRNAGVETLGKIAPQHDLLVRH